MAGIGRNAASGGLGARVRYGYSIANFGKSLQYSTLDLLFLFYLIQYLGTPPALAGTALFAATVADCLTGLAIGHFVDQRGAAGISYRKLMAFGSLACAIIFPTMFLAPLAAPSSSAFAWAIGWFLAYRLGANFIDVPHNALLAALTRDSRERGKLSTLRFFFSSVGNLAVSGLIALFLRSGPTTPPAWPHISARSRCCMRRRWRRAYSRSGPSGNWRRRRRQQWHRCCTR